MSNLEKITIEKLFLISNLVNHSWTKSLQDKNNKEYMNLKRWYQFLASRSEFKLASSKSTIPKQVCLHIDYSYISYIMQVAYFSD